MWTKEQMRQIASTKKFAVVAASAVSLASGSALGYLVSVRKLETKYAEIANKEIEEAKAFYEQKNKVGEFSDPITLAEKYKDAEKYLEEKHLGEEVFTEEELVKEAAESIEITRKLKYHSDSVSLGKPTETEDIEVKESIKKNVFDNSDPVEDDDFDLETEQLNRNEKIPFILAHDEFYENEPEHEQNSLTYFEGDDVLVDEAETPIRDTRKLIGEDNLKFGFGSKDKNVVYIRNNNLGVDFEIVRSFGNYAEEVLGFKHADDKPSLRKFRDRD